MKLRKLVLTLLVIATLLCLVACEQFNQTTDSVTVTFNYGEGLQNTTVSVNVGSTVSEPTAPTKEGYVFGGWYTDADCADGSEWSFDTTVSADITLYAKWSEDNTITVSEALEIAAGLNSGSVADKRYSLYVTVDTISNPTYGEMTVSDDTGKIYVYGSYSADGTIGYSAMEEKPYAGDKIHITALVQNYNGTAELKSVWIQSIEPGESDVDENDYTAMTVAEARNAETGTLIKTSGVVAAITYANGKIPSGFYLVDSTGSIYVYDSQVAPRVSVGNTVTILASKAYWILSDETSYAQESGYKGANQLDDVTLKENDDGNTDFDTSWIQQNTVKEIVDTPVTEDISTTIYKVNALVKKVPGSGFVNYYIDDLDGETGTYVYTQCNGSDFDWLDEFDGKICTVYLSAINAKSTASGSFWRFYPVKVIYENFDVSTVNVAEFVVKYYGVDQFMTEYAADPSLELVSTVSSELLAFENAKLTYSSDNTDSVYFETENDVTVMHVKDVGTATITITGSYGETTYSQTVQITVKSTEEVSGLTVAQAIAANVDESITVRGIVGPSLVNKVGFYLIDCTGTIAVLVKSSDTMSGIAIGNEIVLSGTRDLFAGNEGIHGQTCITDAEVVANYYGKHDYDTSTFITDKTISDLYSLSASEDHSAEVYVVTGTVKFEAGKYSTTVKIVSTDGSTSISLYCSSANQYSWLQAYDGQTVTLEIAMCNWNKKEFYKGCVLAVRLEDGTKVYNTLNFDN